MPIVSHGNVPFREHRQRCVIDGEIHARPFEELTAPLIITHLAVLSGPDAAEADRAHLVSLCERLGVPHPSTGARHHSIDCGVFRLKWERHTEFSEYTLSTEPSGADAFAHPPILTVPSDWLAALPGEVLVATHLALVPATALGERDAALRGVFGTRNLAGSTVMGGPAQVWSDFRVRADGYGRILVLDRGLQPAQAGRLVQRLLNIETYRTLAMLAFPVAVAANADVTRAESELARVTDAIVASDSLDDEQELLARLSTLAATVERSAAATSYRFGATRAYHALVEKRLGELREQRIEGVQTVQEFMERRLMPAMRTVENAAERQEAVARRVSRSGNLLRTRVDVALERQNRDLLASVNQRVHLQLRLQETVEGLSVVVLTYYLIGLLGYGAKALAKLGVPVQAELATGLAIPLVMGVVWLGLRRLRRTVSERRAHASDLA